ncbi:MAG: hypothetical protein ABII80_01070 [bacterium]
MDKFTKINLTPEKNSTVTPKVPVQPVVKKKFNILFLAVGLAIIIGTTSGFFFAKNRLVSSGSGMTNNSLTELPTDSSALKVGEVYGNPDEKTFRDSAEGIIQPGGIAGEGSHHLVRGANESQWVYLTSSVADLDLFVGSKVTIWGETVQGKKAGWLMDVGRLKVLELNVAEIDALEPTQ